MIASIANNHHHDSKLFHNIFQILLKYDDQIKQTFSNYEIFSIFKNNKLILLFLFENKFIKIDAILYQEFVSTFETNGYYCHFFYPELKEFAGDEKTKNIKESLLAYNSTIFDQFDEKRHQGVDDAYISSLIRSDSVEQFIQHINKSNIPLSSTIKASIFETNSFLIENQNSTLIEY